MRPENDRRGRDRADNWAVVGGLASAMWDLNEQAEALAKGMPW